MATHSVHLVAELRGHESQVWSVVWRPHTSEVASCGGRRILVWANSNGWQLKSVVFNDQEDFKSDYPQILGSIGTAPVVNNLAVNLVTVPNIPVTNSGTHERTIRNLGWTSDGRTLAAVSFDATTSIWEEGVDGWKCHAKIEGHENEVKAVAWSPSHRQLATCSRDKTIWIHSLPENSNIGDDPPPVDFLCTAVLSGHAQDVKSVVWHPTQDFIVSASYDNSIRLWAPLVSNGGLNDDEADWQCVATLEGHTSTVWSVSFSPNGNEFASGSDDKTVRIWTASPSDQDESNLPSNRAHDSKLALHPWLYVNPAFRLVVGTKQTDSTPILSSCQWRCSAVITGHHTRTTYCVAWHPQFDVIATACGDDAIRIFRRTHLPTADTVEEPQWVLECCIPSAHSCDVNSVAWKDKPEEDGSWLLGSGGDDGVVRIFSYRQKD